MRFFRWPVFLLALWAVSFFHSLSFGTLEAGNEVSLEKVLEMSSNRYNEIKGFSCRFRQVVEIPLLGKRKEFAGKLNYRSPNMMRLDYDEPAGGYILCDGQSFYIFLPDVDSTRVMKTALETDPRSFLTEFFLKEARSEYDASLVDTDEDSYFLKFIPKNNRAELSRVDLRVERNSNFVRDVSYTDPSGSTTSYHLDDITVSAPSAEFFSFSLPEGLMLLDLTSSQN